MISPLILVFNIATFGLFWIVYRYNTLYVIRFKFDTGGRLFPRAINQLFVGLYVLEICLIGLFFLVRDDQDRASCKGQAIVMIVVTISTAIYQFLLNEAFGPLLTYLPITLEDDAVERDKLFAEAQRERLDRMRNGGTIDYSGRPEIEDVLENRDRGEKSNDKTTGQIELKDIDTGRKRNRLKRNKLPFHLGSKDSQKSSTEPPPPQRVKLAHDVEAQQGTQIGRALFDHIPDQIEDLTPEERDVLVRKAFMHQALRARRPVIWIPRDNLGVSDDEIRRTQQFSRHIWISNEHTGLDSKCRVVYKRSPPDFSEIDLIEL